MVSIISRFFIGFLALSSLAFANMDPGEIENVLFNDFNTKKFKFMYFGGQPDTLDLIEISKADVKAIIDVRGMDEVAISERSIAEGLGVKYYNIPLFDEDLNVIADNVQILEIMHRNLHDIDHLIQSIWKPCCGVVCDPFSGKTWIYCRQGDCLC